jgi:hypothetical protein
MFKIFEKFIGKLKKLDNYYILREEENLIIVGTKIIIKEHKEMLGNIFQPRTQNIDKELPIFFIIAVCDVPFDDKNEFKKKNLPILYLDKYKLAKNSDSIKDILDDFIVDNFKN